MPIQFPAKFITTPGTYQVEQHVQDIQIQPSTQGNFTIYLPTPVASAPVILRVNPKKLTNVTVYAQSGKLISGAASYGIPAGSLNSPEEIFVFFPELASTGLLSGNWTVKQIGGLKTEISESITSVTVPAQTLAEVESVTLSPAGKFHVQAIVVASTPVAGMRVGFGFGYGAIFSSMAPDVLLPNGAARAIFNFDVVSLGGEIRFHIYNGDSNPQNFTGTISITRV